MSEREFERYFEVHKNIFSIKDERNQILKKIKCIWKLKRERVRENPHLSVRVREHFVLVENEWNEIIYDCVAFFLSLAWSFRWDFSLMRVTRADGRKINFLRQFFSKKYSQFLIHTCWVRNIFYRKIINYHFRSVK